MRSVDNKILTSSSLYFCLALVGCIFIYFIPMRWGARVWCEDGLAYINAAVELVNGRGLYIIDSIGGYIPLTHWPPGLPILLAGFSFLGISPVEAARLMNAFLFGVNSFLFGYFLRVYGPKVIWLPILGMVAFMGSTTVLKVSADAMSESLFLCCELLTFLFLLKYMETNNKILLTVAAIFAGWSFLTRYFGITVISTVVIMIVIQHRTQLKKILVDLSLFISIASIPMFFWTVRNILITGKPTSRVFEWHPPVYGTWLILKETLIHWLIPSSFPLSLQTLALLTALFFIILILLIWKPKIRIKTIIPLKNRANNSFIIINLIFIICYFLFFLYTRLFYDVGTNPTIRLTFPIYISILFILIVAIGDIWLGEKHNWKTCLIVLVLCIFISFQTIRSGGWAYGAFRDGRCGYNDPGMRFSETLSYLKNTPNIDFSKIISNDCGAIYYWTFKSTLELPTMYYYTDLVLPPNMKVGDKQLDFEEKWKSTVLKIKPNSLLVYFYNARAGSDNFPSEKELQQRLNLTLLKRYTDGAIYNVN